MNTAELAMMQITGKPNPDEARTELDRQDRVREQYDEACDNLHMLVRMSPAPLLSAVLRAEGRKRALEAEIATFS